MCCVVFVWCLYGVYVVSVWWCCAAAFGAYFGLSASWFLEKFRRGRRDVRGHSGAAAVDSPPRVRDDCD
jgi:hypothetical protein